LRERVYGSSGLKLDLSGICGSLEYLAVEVFLKL
jgi:hypothetical protein